MALVALLALAGCGTGLPSYRYKMTVEVETPEGLRTGSSVIEVKTRKGPGFPGPEAGGISSQVRGEAVTVDLGSRGMMFALLSAEGDADRAAGIAPTALLPELVDKSGTADAWANNLRAMKQRIEAAELPSSYYPMFVRFSDINDPSTIEQVDPNRLSSYFGEGVKFKGIIVQLTDEAVTTGISKRFRWWGQYLDKHFDGSPARINHLQEQNLSAHLSAGSFSTDAKSE